MFNFIGTGHHTITYYGTDYLDTNATSTTSDLNMPVYLTIKYPKNEETLAQIVEKWDVSITGAVNFSFSDLNTDKNVYLPQNTPITIQVVDANGNYFSRTYVKDYNGYVTTDTLQPYLVATTTGLLTTINTVDVATLLPVDNITIKIYKLIPGSGRTLVEQLLTDSKGQALSLLVVNAAYEFEIYPNGVYLRTDQITATSNSIVIKIPSSTTIDQNKDYFILSTNFTPTRNKLITSDSTLTQNIILNPQGINTTSITSIFVWVTDFNATSGIDVNIYSKTIVPGTNNYTNSIVLNTTLKTVDGNQYDGNGNLTVYVQVTLSTGEVRLYSMTYGLPSTRSITQGFSIDLRPMFACSSDPNEPCGMMILAALFLSLIFTIGLAIETGFMSMEGMGIIFIVLMGIFAYLAWVPIILYGLMVIIMIVLGLAIGGNKI